MIVLSLGEGRRWNKAKSFLDEVNLCGQVRKMTQSLLLGFELSP